MSGLYIYYKNVVRPLLILKYHYCKSYEVPKINFIKITIIFNNVSGTEDWRIPMSLKLLNKITGQKAVIKKLGWSQSGGKERRMQYVSSVTLRKHRAYDFLEYLVFVVFPLHCRRYGWPLFNMSKSGIFNCVFSDLNVFYRLPDDLTGFGGKIHVSIKTNSKSASEGLNLLRLLGVPGKL